jgi:hypothetical protein
MGEPKVADEIANDVHLEALAAAGLACVAPEERSAAMEQAWARRVYVVASALNGRAGRILNQHRSTLVPTLRELLDKSVADYVRADGKVVPVVGMGNRPPPTARKVAPAPPDPRSLEPVIPEDDPTIEVARPK